MSSIVATDLPDEATEERLARALEILAGIVAEHGEQHRPLYDLLKGQLDGIRARSRARDQIRRLAMPSSHLADANSGV